MDEGDEMRPVLVSRVSFFQNSFYQRKSETKAFRPEHILFSCQYNLLIQFFFFILCYLFLK
jgi:hypothetical protein